MGKQIAVRLSDEDLAVLDAEVAAGRARDRSDVVRRAVARLRRQELYRREEAILVALARQGEPIYPDLEPIAQRDIPPLD